RLRFALHALTQRNEDRLLFNHQRDLAQQFGFLDDNYEPDVEQFMQYYFKTVMELERMNEMLLQLFSENFFDTSLVKQLYPISNHFVSIDKYIEAKEFDTFEKNPLALLEIFLLLQQNSSLIGIRASTIRLIKKSLYLIDDAFRKNSKANQLFLDIFKASRGVTHQLRQMNRYGILAAYLPSFAHIVARMQYDLFHIYTVDAHTLFVLRNLRRLSLEKHADELPFCNSVFSHISKPEILYLAALFHDIAKGRGGNHAILGAVDATEFCKRHDLSDYDTKLVAWIIQNHLLMSSTAQKKDISDPDIIYEFANQVGDIIHLKYLYLLTVADIRATSDSVWNSWKDSLLKELALSTLALLNHVQVERLESWKDIRETAKQTLFNNNFEVELVDKYLQNLTADYFTKNPAETIVWQAKKVLATSDIDSDDKSNPTIIAIRKRLDGAGSEIFVYSPDKEDLFARLTTTLAQHHLNVQGASIYTDSNGYCHDSFYTLNDMNKPTISDSQQEKLKTAIKKNLTSENWNRRKIQRRMPRQIKHFDVNTEIVFSKDEFSQYTRLDIIARDKPGLLALLAQAFKSCELKLHDARISTLGEKVEDAFIISHRDNSAIDSKSEQVQITKTIKRYIGG
ncbi:MAG: [protein-PII] uridylyltransferase, partial [Kangiellaceae bacterium]|nr:[protein-PII] uridylyltransferase [Kangiellaceae bacterium]